MLTLQKLDYQIKPINFKKSLEFSLQSKKMNTFEFFKYFILEATTLDERAVSELLIQDVFSILIDYLVTTFNNPILSEEPLIYARDFLVNKPNYNEQTININGYRFSNTAITLEKAINAERYCYMNGDADFLGIYLLAESCLKGRKEGVETLLNLPDTPEHREKIKTLNTLMGQVSYAKCDFLVDFKNVSLITKDNYFMPLETEFFFYT